MKKQIWGLIIIVALSIPIFSSSWPNKLNVSGHYLGVFNSIEQNDTQFDFAGNIDFNYALTPEWSGMVQFQGGTGHGSLGFVGPQPAVTDISLVYHQPSDQLKLTFGSFDTPFGLDTNNLTNNANAFGSPFVINSVIYSALAGPVGTLNTLGVKVDKTWREIQAVAMVSNGTSETAANANKTVASLVQVSHQHVATGIHIAGTYWRSNDTDDAQYTSDESNGFQTDLTAYMIDIHWHINLQHRIKSSIGQLTYNDHNATTNDTVDIYALGYEWVTSTWMAGIHGSHWAPDNANTVSNDLPAPGLFPNASPNQKITRYQLGLGYFIDPTILAKLALFQDTYTPLDDTVSGGIISMNVAF
jgi:hypothetical protein